MSRNIDVPALVASAVTWVLSGALIGWWFARRDWRTMPPPGVFTRLRPWDRRRVYERVLRIRAWKDRLPEAGTWFGGVSKRRLPALSDGGRARFFAESLRAERVHLVYLLVVPLTAAWSRDWLLVANAMFGVVVNVPCIAVARYNRIRLAHLA